MIGDEHSSKDLQQLHANIESLRAVATDSAIGALNAIPLVGGPLAAWISQFQQRELFKRLLSVLDDAVVRIRQLEEKGRQLSIDDEYIEFVGEVGLLAARTRSEYKRQYFAGLLATGAVKFRVGERDRGRMMAAILNHLDDAVLQLFLSVMSTPCAQSVNGFWGAYRRRKAKWTDFPTGSGQRLQILATQGLIDVESFRTAKTDQFDLVVTDVGIEFFRWISSQD